MQEMNDNNNAIFCNYGLSCVPDYIDDLEFHDNESISNKASKIKDFMNSYFSSDNGYNMS